MTKDELETLLEKLRYLSRRRLGGGLLGEPAAQGLDRLLRDVIRDMDKRKVRTVIDADGEALRKALTAEPSLASPNQREAEALVGQEFQTDEDFQRGAAPAALDGRRQRADHAADRVLRAAPRGQGPAAHVPGVDPAGGGGVVGRIGRRPAGRVRVGPAGRAPAEECLRLALGCGAANTQTVGAGVFDPRDVARFAAMVEVQEIRPRAARAS